MSQKKKEPGIDGLLPPDPWTYENGTANGFEEEAEDTGHEAVEVKSPVKRHKPRAIPIATRRIPIVSHIAEKPVRVIRGVYEIR